MHHYIPKAAFKLAAAALVAVTAPAISQASPLSREIELFISQSGVLNWAFSQEEAQTGYLFNREQCPLFLESKAADPFNKKIRGFCEENLRDADKLAKIKSETEQNYTAELQQLERAYQEDSNKTLVKLKDSAYGTANRQEIVLKIGRQTKFYLLTGRILRNEKAHALLDAHKAFVKSVNDRFRRAFPPTVMPLTITSGTPISLPPPRP